MSELPALLQDVLLVEDNELVGEVMCRRLSRFAVTVHWAKTGVEGLALYQAHAPQCVVVDQRLPGLLGSELVREIRSRDRLLPVIGLTASAMGGEIEALEAAGTTIAVEKPLSLTDLRIFLQAHFPGLAGV